MSDVQTHRLGIVRLGQVFLGFPIENLIEVFPRGKEVMLPGVSELVRNGVELRGQVIPLMELRKIAQIAADDAQAKLGVVLEYNQKQVAFYVEEIVGIEAIAPAAFRSINNNGAGQSTLFGRGFHFNDTYGTVVDLAGLFALPDVYTTDRIESGNRMSRSRGRSMMMFEAGGVIYAIPAVEVYAAVPKKAIIETAITSGPCLGEIAYHDRRVPVVCPVRVLGLGTRQKKTLSEVVVLRFPDDLIVGFAVDAINDIQSLDAEKNAQIPLWQDGESLISSVTARDDGIQVFSIDVDKLRGRKEIAEIADLSKRTEDPKEQKNVASKPSGSVTRERERYLVVELAGRMAIPLLQVTCILNQPKRLTQTDAAHSGFKGYFDRFGKAVALIDLKERLGQGLVEGPEAQILLTGEKDHQVGFLVEKVIGIEVSQWRERRLEGQQAMDCTYVQLRGQDAETVLPYLDLRAELGPQSDPVQIPPPAETPELARL